MCQALWHGGVPRLLFLFFFTAPPAPPRTLPARTTHSHTVSCWVHCWACPAACFQFGAVTRPRRGLGSPTGVLAGVRAESSGAASPIQPCCAQLLNRSGLDVFGSDFGCWNFTPGAARPGLRHLGGGALGLGSVPLSCEKSRPMGVLVGVCVWRRLSPGGFCFACSSPLLARRSRRPGVKNGRFLKRQSRQ